MWIFAAFVAGTVFGGVALWLYLITSPVYH